MQVIKMEDRKTPLRAQPRHRHYRGAQEGRDYARCSNTQVLNTFDTTAYAWLRPVPDALCAHCTALILSQGHIVLYSTVMFDSAVIYRLS